jgi:ribosomal protein S27E
MKNKFRIEAEIVKGECPTCSEITTLVGVSSQFFRCMECGADLEQHVNGKISYLPIMAIENRWRQTLRIKDWK